MALKTAAVVDRSEGGSLWVGGWCFVVLIVVAVLLSFWKLKCNGVARG